MDTSIKPIDTSLTSELVVLSLDQDTIEVNLILKEIIGYRLPLVGLLALSIQYIPIDKASRRELILLLVFLTLYSTNQADLNTL